MTGAPRALAAGHDGARAERMMRLIGAAADRLAMHDSGIAGALADGLAALSGGFGLPPPVEVLPCRVLPDLCAGTSDPLVAQVLDCRGELCWRPPGYGRLPVAVSGRMEVVELAGPNGMFTRADLRFGLLLQRENVDYPSHRHAAEELYLVLAGCAGWALDDGAYTDCRTGSFVHHRAWQPHAMKTGPAAMLTMWGWTGDIGSASYTV